jgi:uncharacterized low-complexity protein
MVCYVVITAKGLPAARRFWSPLSLDADTIFMDLVILAMLVVAVMRSLTAMRGHDITRLDVRQHIRGKTRYGRARHDKARQGKAGEGKARQGKARQGKARQGKARQGILTLLLRGHPSAGHRATNTSEWIRKCIHIRTDIGYIYTLAFILQLAHVRTINIRLVLQT